MRYKKHVGGHLLLTGKMQFTYLLVGFAEKAWPRLIISTCLVLRQCTKVSARATENTYKCCKCCLQGAKSMKDCSTSAPHEATAFRLEGAEKPWTVMAEPQP